MAGGYAHKIQLTVTSSSGVQSITGYDLEAPNSEIVLNQSFAANSNNAAFTLSLNAAKLQDVYLLSSQNATLYMNNSNANSITLTAGIPLVWGTSMGYGSNPFNGVVSNAALSCNAATQLRGLIGTL